MSVASVELERRRPVWAALSELFLDTELQPADHQRIAMVLATSGYSESELERILRREVGPVLVPNLLSVAGEWAGFDLSWLEAEILRASRRSWSRWLAGAAAIKLVHQDWECIRAKLNAERVA